MKISVIISVYNHSVEYLDVCLSSLLAQAMTDIEFIVVDNAATLESKKLIERYANIDDRFKVIHLTENKGYGRALNIGLKKATGEYVAFVDSDDWAENDMYEILYSIAQNCHADIVKGLFYLCNGTEDKKLGLKFDFSKYNRVLRPDEIKEYPLKFGSFWSAIYKREMLIINDIKFDELPNPAAEDIMFILKTYLCSNSIYITPHVVFNKRMDNPNSSMKKKDEKIWICLKLYKLLENYIAKHSSNINKSLLGVKTKREFLNFYWGFNNDITKNRLPFIFEYSKLFKHNLKMQHYDPVLFNDSERKIFNQIANNPIKFYLKQLFYKKKITHSHEKRYLFGIQYYTKRLKSNNLIVQNNVFNHIFDLVNSTWLTSGATDELMYLLKFFSQSRYTMKNLREEFMYIYIACLLERGYVEEARKILNICKNYFKFKELYRYIYVSDFCLQNGISTPESTKSVYIAQCFDKNNKSNVLKNYLKNKTIAVVGNSGCELGKNKGQEIDSHDVVIRFGNYPYEYIKDYGRKTNIWVRASGSNSKDVEQRKIDNLDFVIWNQDFEHTFIQYNLLDYMYEHCIKYPNKYLYLDGQYRKAFINESSVLFPSSGAMLIYYLKQILGNFDNVDIYGFAFLNKDCNDNQHYYDNKCKISSEHAFNSEIEFLNKLYSVKN